MEEGPNQGSVNQLSGEGSQQLHPMTCYPLQWSQPGLLISNLGCRLQRLFSRQETFALCAVKRIVPLRQLSLHSSCHRSTLEELSLNSSVGSSRIFKRDFLFRRLDRRLRPLRIHRILRSRINQGQRQGVLLDPIGPGTLHVSFRHCTR